MAPDADLPVGVVRGSDGPHAAALQRTTGTIVCDACGHETFIHGIIVGVTPIGDMFELDIVPSEQDKILLKFHQITCTGKKE